MNPPATGRKESVTFQLCFDGGPHAIEQRQVDSLQVIKRRRPLIVSSTLDDNLGRCVGLNQRWQDRLQDQSRTSSSTNSKFIGPWSYSTRLELQRLRSQLGTDYFCIANLGGRFHRRQVLSHQPRFLAASPNTLNPD